MSPTRPPNLRRPSIGAARRNALVLLSAAGIGLGAGSAPLPDYAAPKARRLDASDRPSGDQIPYRTLTRADFQARRPPLEAREHAEKLGAETCALVVPTSEIQIAGEAVKGPDGSVRYRGRIRGLAFRAVMDRSCSWWNDAASSIPPAYLLEHEQIHFALAELAARGLNARAASLIRGFQFESPRPEEIAPNAKRYVEGAIRQAMQALVERNAAFDRATSLGYQPDRQAAWRERVEAELRASQRDARVR